MKKLFIIGALLFGLTANGAILSTNILCGANNYQTNGFVLLTSGANVYQVILQSPASAGTASASVLFKDSKEWGAPSFGTYYTNAAYVSRVGYSTNLTNYYIGHNNYTNTYINTGYFTYTVTNAAATNNLLPILGAFAVAGQQTATYQANMLFKNGISVLPSTNVNVIIFYDPL